MTTLQTIQAATEATIQSQTRQDPEQRIGLVFWMARTGLYLYPWWSPQRDYQLREFWKKTDHLAGAVFTMTAKMTAIPLKVVPRNTAIRDHIYQAEEMTERLYNSAQFGEGWSSFYSKWVEELCTQDNGAFAEVIGPGPKDGPLIGQPISVAHLDSYRCIRTGVPEFPVIYQDVDGSRYKLHYSRVIYAAQQSSPIADMNGVGFCSVSRCCNVSQNLLDILTFKQEKLGSRPHRAIIITKGGLDPEDLRSAFQAAEAETDSMGLNRYSKVVVAGSSSIEDAGYSMVELSSLPEGFDEQTSVVLGMATIALAFGVDARELFPSMTAGATRADALLQHLKQRGKGPGQILETTERLFNFKYLPSHLKLVFDFQDDAEDRQIAEIKRYRAERRNLDIQSSAISVRTAREQMLETGDLDRAQFEWLELQDGRLEDGTPVVSLFYSSDPFYKKHLKLKGVSDPLAVEENDPIQVLAAINKQSAEVNKTLAGVTTGTALASRVKWQCVSALAALKQLKKEYNLDNGAPPPKNLPSTPAGTPAGRNIRDDVEDLTTPNPDNEANIAPRKPDQALISSSDDQAQERQ